MQNFEKIHCIVDGAAGIHVPQKFAQNFNTTEWGFDADDENIAILDDGPDNEYYWESWDIVTQNAQFTDNEGKVWNLMTGDNLYSVREDYKHPE